ncbi:right-handed parallel beta-helix repeat-containing protein [Candidatus Nitronereus thalassa]|uniref:Right-handed parallel beta-helix repeat-containing protein n=1 Tax=Candidatus Nitronereus thalassa TaxID=3020898 RepID=A0ABU3K5B7_9BACT|nr:right-handed parallel beta-helix repeat-containing protein [Candidatus Nitronereus thalassa]MDT7041556.1 right-handed parallel beta-helix repeat-containing protein [Candidatus Nitronereus thalassa]
MRNRTYHAGLISVMVLNFIAIVLFPAFSYAASNYYVATNGNDGNSCSSAKSESTPKKTINSGVGCLAPGDTLYVKSGTYNEWLNNSIPGGTSWSSPVTVSAYPGHTVIIKGPSGVDRTIHIQGANKKYIILNGLIVDAQNSNYDAIKLTRNGAGDEANHIRIQNCEIRNAKNIGIMVGVGSDSHEFLNLNLHDNGTVDVKGDGLYGYAIYIEGSNSVLEESIIWNSGSWGVHVYNGHDNNANNNIIRKNIIYDNAMKRNTGGVIIGSGSGNMVYNNIIRNNYKGIRLNRAAKVFHNTVYDNPSMAVELASGGSSSEIRNNIFWKNGTNGIVGSAISSHNLSSNPGFVSESNNDFKLTSSSLAIDAGTNLSEVSDDFLGGSRPQGNKSDIGAYEYGVTVADNQPPAPPTNLQFMSN